MSNIFFIVNKIENIENFAILKNLFFRFFFPEKCPPFYYFDASAPRNPILKGKRKTRTLPGGTLSRERWKNLTMTIYGLRNHRRRTIGRTFLNGKSTRKKNNWEK